MRLPPVCLLVFLISTISQVRAQVADDPESAYGIKLAEQADVLVSYEDATRIRVSAKNHPSHFFSNENSSFQYIDASFKKRNLIVLVFEPSARYANKNLRPLADRLQGKFEKLGFSTIVFELGSAEAVPIYRIYKSDL